MRVALHSILRDGAADGYENAHQRIPDDLDASFRRVGISDWSIWRSGRHLFHVVECDDFAAAMAALDTDPANRRWQEFINRYVDHFESTGDAAADMALGRVWRLRQQRGERP
ncbi:L-rhamnose mutarotase [Murinocardiopsis flavida]|uniref:L-rhamnose mutarotase n=1 Tax=Murinocardiopsis flavida TaxID=645275 RepID=A0A2P8DFF4_9ACTN|nr:L-rhamnose mutarotase [Murinocardiopsis flavida]PSK95930.1 L-rhamnose mutarotase [Murinocardiopsis flavida]